MSTEPHDESGMFIRHPKLHEGRRVTQENMAELAAWCDGQIYGAGTRDAYIRVPNESAGQPRSRSEARVGQWILVVGRNAYVYSNTYLRRNFVPYDGESAPLLPKKPTPDIPVQESSHCCCHHNHGPDNVRQFPNTPQVNKFNNPRRHLG